MSDRRRYTILISRSVWEEFMKGVGKVHGAEYGAKSLELEEAFNNHIPRMRRKK